MDDLYYDTPFHLYHINKQEFECPCCNGQDTTDKVLFKLKRVSNNLSIPFHSFVKSRFSCFCDASLKISAVSSTMITLFVWFSICACCG